MAPFRSYACRLGKHQPAGSDLVPVLGETTFSCALATGNSQKGTIISSVPGCQPRFRPALSGGGGWLCQQAGGLATNSALFLGYGQAVGLQGLVLLSFDTSSMLISLRRYRMRDAVA